MIALVVTRGYGNGTFDGSIAKIVTRGYGATAVQISFPVEQNDAAGIPKRTSISLPTIDLLREDDEVIQILMAYFK